MRNLTVKEQEKIHQFLWGPGQKCNKNGVWNRNTYICSCGRTYLSEDWQAIVIEDHDIKIATLDYSRPIERDMAAMACLRKLHERGSNFQLFGDDQYHFWMDVYHTGQWHDNILLNETDPAEAIFAAVVALLNALDEVTK